MTVPLRERLRDQILVCDGAMGTMLHATGVALDRSLPELNLSDPARVKAIHDAYIAAGAQIIQTNTFGAARVRLRAHAIEDRVAEINLAAVEIAREAIRASGRPILLAGSVGPMATGALRTRITPSERMTALEEQVQALVSGGADLLIFETFVDLGEMVEAVKVTRSLADVPIVAQMTFVEDGRTISGDEPEEVARTLERLGVDVVGVNCSLGPQGILRVLAQLGRHTDLPLSAQPNAGQAKMVGAGRFRYRVDDDYFARQAVRSIELGACVVGGCCGTTPGQIAATAKAVAGTKPARRRPPSRPASAPRRDDPPRPPAPAELSGRLASGGFVVVAQLNPLGGGDAEGLVRAGRAILERGIDLIAIAPSTTTRAQMSPISAAFLLQQRLPVQTLVSMTTWDKSIMALQADLLGAHSCGVRTVICRTGSPPLQGDYPNLDGIWDVDSIGLIRLLHALNQGRDYNGMPIRVPTSFCMGARINPGAQDLDHELSRARLKLAAGARFLVTDPVYELTGVRRLLHGLEPSPPPILLGLAPLRDFTQAEYLRHEVPDVSMPPEVLERMWAAGDRGAAVGLEICRELAHQARGLVHGLVLAVDDPEVDLAGALPAEVTASRR
jgi:methionine synthase I (cobalamin-dependent)/5,10-methylenetetrahydrofolate reductase